MSKALEKLKLDREWWEQDASMLWNVRPMARDLLEKGHSSSQKIGNLIIFITITCGIILLVGPRNPTEGTTLESLLLPFTTVVVIAAGLFLANRANAKGDDKDFVGRVVCLGSWVGIRVVFFGWIPGHLLIGGMGDPWKEYLDARFGILLQIVFFCWLYHCMRVVSQIALKKDNSLAAG